MARTIRNIIETLVFPVGTRHELIPLQIPACQPLREADVDVCGRTEAPQGYRVERYDPDSHEILYLLDGAGKLSTPDKTVDVHPSQVLLLPSGTLYSYECTTPQWRIVWFHVMNTGMWLVLEGHQPSAREAAMMRQVDQAVGELLAESVRPEVGSSRLMALYAEEIVLYLGREVAAGDNPRARRMRQRLHELWTFVNANLHEIWNVPAMADRLHMSQAQFHRTCLRYEGCSPMHKVFLLRMQRAEQMLVTYDYPLKLIAEGVGYGTPFAFSNAFKRYKGVSPMHYRSRRTQRRPLETNTTPEKPEDL